MPYRRTLREAKETVRLAFGEKSPDLFRRLCLTDLWFFLTYGCRRIDLKNQWFLDRCDEVQANPVGYLDLWAREHGKSSIGTFGFNLQRALRYPETCTGIFSHTRPMAKTFLRVIKRELEQNQFLKDVFPDVLWDDPEKESPKWSEDDGLILKRKGNPKESTFEAWGLIEGMPTGKHFDYLDFDDIVTMTNAGSPEMREKVSTAFKYSLNLGKRGGERSIRGTRYHYGDPYADILEAGTAKPRIYPAADKDGTPVLLTREELDAKRRDMGPYVFASQMMLDPRQDSAVGFSLDWLRTYTGGAEGLTYVIVDPANSKKKKSDYTAVVVVTCGTDRNYYIRWLCRDRLNLVERINLAFWLHREFKPRAFGYEEYGLQADIEAIKIEQDRQRYRFDITPLGGTTAKFDRIQGLSAIFDQRRVYLPASCFVATKDSGELVDQVNEFVKMEYTSHPYSSHDDMLDALARILDPALGVSWPREVSDSYSAHARMMKRRVDRRATGWVA